MMTLYVFKKKIQDYYDLHRRSLPWRPFPHKKNIYPISPYMILVSEIMLQQTQVSRIIPKYNLFILHFPNFESLAKAPLSQVLKIWQGLGYNRRAVGLKKIAEIVTHNHNGKLPRDYKTLISLPCIGPNTANSILTFAFNIPTVFIETNIRSVFIYFFFPNIKGGVRDQALLPLIAQTLDQKNPREWYYALMDYGAMLKTTLRKSTGNPSRKSLTHRPQSRFKGSNRQLRGALIRLILLNRKVSQKELKKQIKKQLPNLFSDEKIDLNLMKLEKEGFIRKTRTGWAVAK